MKKNLITYSLILVFGLVTGLATEAQGVPASWYFGPSLDYERYGLDVVCYNENIYAIGGHYSNKLEVLEKGSSGWLELSPLPVIQGFLAAALVGSKIYTMGGYGSLDICQIYDIDTDTWQSGPNLPIGLYWATAEAIGDKIYLIGGYRYINGQVYLNTLYILDTVSNEWTQGADIPSSLVLMPASAVYNNHIYVFFSSTNVYGVCYKYNVESNTWSLLPKPPSDRMSSEAVTVGDKIYLIGGNGGYIYAAYKTFEIFDPVSETWEVGPELNVGRYHYGAAYTDGKIYAVGGRDENALPLDSVEILELPEFCNNGEDDDGDDLIDCDDPDCAEDPACVGCEVTLRVENANAAPGETDVAVEVSLENLNNVARGVQVDVCDEGDYLTCTGCEGDPTRAEFFSCSTNELEDGCCRVILVPDGGILIEEGTGTILTIHYDVSEDAPGGCKDLTLTNAKVSDEVEDPLPLCELEPGEFCFALCGDINPSIDPTNCGDFVVDILDVLDAIDITLGVIAVPTECQWFKGDVPNGLPLPEGMGCREPNGEIDIFDILVIIDVVLERPNCCVL